jgi:hypothetical protein
MLACVGHRAPNTFHRPIVFQMNLRRAPKLPIDERWKIEVVGDGIHILNRRNVTDETSLCDPTSGSCAAGTPQGSSCTSGERAHPSPRACGMQIMKRLLRASSSR